MKNNKLLFYIFLVFLPLFSFSQKVENIHFEQVGKQIHIYCDLQGDETYNIEIFCRTDNGQSWGQPLQKVTGAVGANQQPGTNKEIIWDVLAEREKLTGEISFKIEATPSNTGYFTDTRDGQTYKWVKIGSQVWMGENLNIGEQIKGQEKQANNGIIEKYCFDDKSENCNTYGGLYQWNEMMQYSSNESSRDICPDGWHVPTDDEWKQLEIYLRMSKSEADKQGLDRKKNNLGKKLKSRRGWGGNNNGLDLFGFSALPGSMLSIQYGGKFELYNSSYWWTSTECDTEGAWNRTLFTSGNLTRDCYNYYGAKNSGLSIRCIKNK